MGVQLEMELNDIVCVMLFSMVGGKPETYI